MSDARDKAIALLVLETGRDPDFIEPIVDRLITAAAEEADARAAEREERILNALFLLAERAGLTDEIQAALTPEKTP